MINIKKIASEAIKYKSELYAILNSLDSSDMEKGLIVIKETLISNDLKPLILSQGKGIIENYKVNFENDSIKLNLSIDGKQLGPLNLEYSIQIKEFRFDNSGHKIYATYSESSQSLGNIAQKMALKAALINGPLLKTLIKIANISYIFVDGNNLFIDVDKMQIISKIPEDLTLNYISAKDSKLSLLFNI